MRILLLLAMVGLVIGAPIILQSCDTPERQSLSAYEKCEKRILRPHGRCLNECANRAEVWDSVKARAVNKVCSSDCWNQYVAPCLRLR